MWLSGFTCQRKAGEAPDLQHAPGILEFHKANDPVLVNEDHTPLCLHLPGASEVGAPRKNGFLFLLPTQCEGKTVSLNKL